jgi:hypothetical protein
MGNSVPIPERPAVPKDKTRICVAGYGISHNVGRAQRLASTIAKAYPQKYQTWFYFSTFGFSQFLNIIKAEIPEDQKSHPSTKDKGKTMAEHASAPFVWLETAATTTTTTTAGTDQNKTIITAKGGGDMFREWARKEFPENADIQELAKAETPTMSESFFDNATPGGTWMNEWMNE